ncbi:MAG: C-GCAxxG-C-C family protein [Selenomonadaceae bacterium]
MNKYVEKALENHKKGYNCSQAVACAYAEAAGVDETTMFKIMEGYGFGMGDSKGTCGAVSGAIALVGFCTSDGNIDAPSTKQATYKLACQVTSEFAAKNGSMKCRDLKGIDTKKVLRSCDGCIADATEIVGRVLFRKS